MSEVTSTIYFVRHGECKANVVEMNLPPEVDLITEKGILQASLTGKHFQDEIFTQAYASTFSRAEVTAREILKQVKGSKPELKIDSRIRERELGEYENRPMMEMLKDMFVAARDHGTKMLEYEVTGGETVNDMENRLGSFLEDLLQGIRESKTPQNILVVSHGVVIMRMILKLRLWSKDPTKSLTFHNFSVQPLKIPMKNTTYHQLTVKTYLDGRANVDIEINKVGEGKHLDSLKPEVVVPPTAEFQYMLKTWVEVTDSQCATM